MLTNKISTKELFSQQKCYVYAAAGNDGTGNSGYSVNSHSTQSTAYGSGGASQEISQPSQSLIHSDSQLISQNQNAQSPTRSMYGKYVSREPLFRKHGSFTSTNKAATGKQPDFAHQIQEYKNVAKEREERSHLQSIVTVVAECSHEIKKSVEGMTTDIKVAITARDETSISRQDSLCERVHTSCDKILQFMEDSEKAQKQRDDAIKSLTTEVKSSHSLLNTKLTDLTEAHTQRHDDLVTNITEIKTGLAELVTENGAANRTAIGGVQQDIVGIHGDINQLQNRMTTDISQLKEELIENLHENTTSQQNQLDHMYNKLSHHIEQSITSSLNQGVRDISVSVCGIVSDQDAKISNLMADLKIEVIEIVRKNVKDEIGKLNETNTDILMEIGGFKEAVERMNMKNDARLESLVERYDRDLKNNAFQQNINKSFDSLPKNRSFEAVKNRPENVNRNRPGSLNRQDDRSKEYHNYLENSRPRESQILPNDIPNHQGNTNQMGLIQSHMNREFDGELNHMNENTAMIQNSAMIQRERMIQNAGANREIVSDRHDQEFADNDVCYDIENCDTVPPMSQYEMESNGMVSVGISSNGPTSYGGVSNELASNGAASNVLALNGLASNGLVSNGLAANRLVSNAMVSHEMAPNKTFQSYRNTSYSTAAPNLRNEVLPCQNGYPDRQDVFKPPMFQQSYESKHLKPYNHNQVNTKLAYCQPSQNDMRRSKSYDTLVQNPHDEYPEDHDSVISMPTANPKPTKVNIHVNNKDPENTQNIYTNNKPGYYQQNAINQISNTSSKYNHYSEQINKNQHIPPIGQHFTKPFIAPANNENSTNRKFVPQHSNNFQDENSEHYLQNETQMSDSENNSEIYYDTITQNHTFPTNINASGNLSSKPNETRPVQGKYNEVYSKSYGSNGNLSTINNQPLHSNFGDSQNQQNIHDNQIAVENNQKRPLYKENTTQNPNINQQVNQYYQEHTNQKPNAQINTGLHYNSNEQNSQLNKPVSAIQRKINTAHNFPANIFSPPIFNNRNQHNKTDPSPVAMVKPMQQRRATNEKAVQKVATESVTAKRPYKFDDEGITPPPPKKFKKSFAANPQVRRQPSRKSKGAVSSYKEPSLLISVIRSPFSKPSPYHVKVFPKKSPSSNRLSPKAKSPFVHGNKNYKKNTPKNKSANVHQKSPYSSKFAKPISLNGVSPINQYKLQKNIPKTNTNKKSKSPTLYSQDGHFKISKQNTKPINKTLQVPMTKNNYKQSKFNANSTNFQATKTTDIYDFTDTQINSVGTYQPNNNHIYDNYREQPSNNDTEHCFTVKYNPQPVKAKTQKPKNYQQKLKEPVADFNQEQNHPQIFNHKYNQQLKAPGQNYHHNNGEYQTNSNHKYNQQQFKVPGEDLANERNVDQVVPIRPFMNYMNQTPVHGPMVTPSTYSRPDPEWITEAIAKTHSRDIEDVGDFTMTRRVKSVRYTPRLDNNVSKVAARPDCFLGEPTSDMVSQSACRDNIRLGHSRKNEKRKLCNDITSIRKGLLYQIQASVG